MDTNLKYFIIFCLWCTKYLGKAQRTAIIMIRLALLYLHARDHDTIRWALLCHIDVDNDRIVNEAW